MATREENLKKVNDKLKELSDEELDKVAGGRRRLLSYLLIDTTNPSFDSAENNQVDNATKN